jgi:signal transduction histidine kinase
MQRQVALESAVPEDAIVVHGDVTLLEQAVSNVVYNAIRHNRAGGHVAVVLERPPARQFRLRVIDDGPGIPEAELSCLVERGFRGEQARTRNPEGQGIGLHITYQVAQLHGLSLTLGRSEYGGLEVVLGDEEPRSPTRRS